VTTPISRFEKITDIGFKIFSIAAICFGGVRYFQERDQIAQSDAQARSISYIEEYGSERYVAARLALHDFWTERPQLVQMLSNGGISQRVYQTALKQYVFRALGEDQISESKAAELLGLGLAELRAKRSVTDEAVNGDSAVNQ